MHDGITTYPGVLDVIQQLRQANKELIILSNSSKRQDNSIKVLTKLGFKPDDDFTKILTSGEVSYQLLRAASSGSDDADINLTPKPWPVLDEVDGTGVFCFGSGDGDEEYIESAGWKLTTMDKAQCILSRGTFAISDGVNPTTHKKHDGEDAYFKRLETELQIAAKRKLPMIVANPDKIRPDADRSPMPGQIGDAYEKELRNVSENNPEDLVKRIGKPFSDVYEIALREGNEGSMGNKKRVCMIGDALETDVTGGTFQDIDTIWVINDGIHNVAVEEQMKMYDNNGDRTAAFSKACHDVVHEFNQQTGTYAKDQLLRPTLIVPHFRW